MLQITELVKNALKDGEWHFEQALLLSLVGKIPPELAINRNRRERKRVVDRVNLAEPPLGVMLRRGIRMTVQPTLIHLRQANLVEMRDVEVDGGRKRRQWRLIDQEYLAWVRAADKE